MKTPKATSNKEYPKTDNYLARVVGITDMGIQPGFEWKGEMTKPAAKVELTYELVTTEMSDGRPFWVSESGTYSTASKWLQQRCLATGVSIEDISPMIGKPVMLNVATNDKGYPKVTNVAGVPAGIPVPELRNPTQLFDLNDPDLSLWEKFPDFKKDKIREATNFKQTKLAELLHLDDDTPF